MWEQLKHWDRDVLIYINNLTIERFDSFWVFVTQIENWTLLYVLFFFLFFSVYPKLKAVKGVALTIVVFIISLFLTGIVKYSVARVRPNNIPDLKPFIRILQTPDHYSFFSGHAAVSFAVTTFVVLVFRNRFKWIYVFYIWPIIFSMSRIFVGVHYPSDILVGTGIGISIAVLTWKYVSKRILRY